jgi:ubiquinone/menaquinone biosynthesis C-methylase UbiE
MNEFDLKAKDWDSDPGKIERARAVADGITAGVPLSLQMTALEYGCGTGLLSFALRSRFEQITLADSSPGMLAVLGEKISLSGAANMSLVQLDLTEDPLPVQRFDVIYTMMTLHHVPDTDKILRDFFELLKTPGYLCVADLDKEDGSFHGPRFDGHAGFDREVLGESARMAGFHSIRFTTVHELVKETGDEKKVFPIFLMIAEKK